MRIYLDHNATTPVRGEVAEAMVGVLRDHFGNPSSTHAEGSAARAQVEHARGQVAALLGVEPAEVLLTGGATEANNTALGPVLAARRGNGAGHLVTSTIEHPSVDEPVTALEAAGWRVTRVGVGRDGADGPKSSGELS